MNSRFVYAVSVPHLANLALTQIFLKLNLLLMLSNHDLGQICTRFLLPNG